MLVEAQNAGYLLSHLNHLILLLLFTLPADLLILNNRNQLLRIESSYKLVKSFEQLESIITSFQKLAGDSTSYFNLLFQLSISTSYFNLSILLADLARRSPARRTSILPADLPILNNRNQLLCITSFF